jgi:DNA-directed RNA polymerase subunit RPC12/RpoP
VSKSRSIITENNYVECPYCPKGESNKFKLLHWKHLKKLHNKTLDDVIKEFPDLPTITKTEYDKKINSAKMGGDKAKATHNILKTINCIYCQKELQVPNNYSNKIACQECLDKGLENPDGKTKELANINRVKTLQKEYGEEIINVQQIKEVRDKTSKTNNEKYGGTGFASKELNEKTVNTIKEIYDVDNIMKTDYGKSFFIGDLNPMKKPEIAKKVSEKLKGQESHLKGQTYDEIFGEEKANELKEKSKENEINDK